MASLQAATIYQTFTGNLQTGDSVPGGLDQVSLNISRFDPSLGTLTAVQFDLTSNFRSGVTFYHATANGLTFTYTPRNYLGVEFFGFSEVPPPVLVDHTLPTQNYTDTTPWGGSLWQPTASDTATSTQTVNNPADLPAYVGMTFFQATLTIEDRCLYVSSDPLAYVNDKHLSSDFTFTVRYDYLPVPEPTAGWTVEAAACLLAGWVRLHRKRSRPDTAAGSSSGPR